MEDGQTLGNSSLATFVFELSLFRSSRGRMQLEWLLEGRSTWWAALTEQTSCDRWRGSTQGLAGGRRWVN